MDEPRLIKITDTKIAMAKAEHYCAYQDRAQQEVRDKLYQWGLWTEAVENIIAELIQGNFLNEERFAYSYAQGKFNQKGWGRIKIKQGLQFKKVPEVLIKKALLKLDGDKYILALHKLLSKKAAVLAEKNPYKRKYKLRHYALGRGYEGDLIDDVLKDSGL